MAGEAYPKRWPAGFADNDAARYADAPFLNNVEAALLRLLGADPIDQGVQVWDTGLGRMKSIKLTNSQIDPAAAIDKSKLAALNIVDADISASAGIAKSKLNLNGAITNADIQAAAAILGSKLQFSAGTSPPGSPVTGDLWLYEDVTNNIYWMFRYNSAQTTYKWEFVGGVPSFSSVETTETTASVTFADLATVGPSFTLPRAGDYRASLSASLGNSNAGASISVGLMKQGVEQTRTDMTAPGALYMETAAAIWRITGAAASDVIKLQYLVSAGTGTFFRRRLEIQPIRVS